MSKQAHTCNTCTLWVQGLSILIKDDGAGTDIENKKRQQKLLVNCNHPHDGWGLRKNGIKFLRGDSFIVRASCSADPDKRVHSISVMDPGFPVCGGGEQITHAHVLLPLGYGGAAVSSSIGSREEHITLYFDINS